MWTRKDMCTVAVLLVLPHGGCLRSMVVEAEDSTDSADDPGVDASTSLMIDSDAQDDGADPEFAGGSAPSSATTPSAPVGTVDGVAGVDRNGQATYRVKIEVPPGAAGMQPDLALSYSSSGQDGLIGVGWALEGLGRVERCEKTIADDGAPSGVRYANDDALCLDGMRLVAVDGTSGSDGAEYRTRLDRYARVIGHGSIGTEDSWFEVFHKDGRISLYGRNPDARIRRDGVPLVWTLDEVSDRIGHVVSYTYEAEEHEWSVGGVNGVNMAGDVAHRPLRIDYTQFGASAPLRSVLFRYHGVDPRDGWSRGAPIRRTHLLAGIDTHGPDGLVRTYSLRYEQGATERWRLAELQLCDAHASCLPPTRFAWDDGVAAGFSDVVGSYDGQSYQPEVFLDQAPPFRVVLDFNGDGSSDLATLSDLDPAGEWKVWLGEGRDGAYPNFTEIETDLDPRPAYAYDRSADTGMQYRAQAIDFNDDRHDDLIYVNGRDADEEFHVFGTTLQLLVSHGETPATMGFEVVDIEDDEPASAERIYHALFPDLDGDGREDVLLCRGETHTDGTWVYALNRPTGIGGSLTDGYEFDFSDGGVDTGFECSVFDDYLEVDRDGDGADDVLLIPAFAGGAPIPEVDRGDYQALQIDTASGTADLVDARLPRDLAQRRRNCVGIGTDVPPSWVGAGPGQDRLGDFNGDGLVDVLRYELAVGDGLDQLDAILAWFTDGAGCPPSLGAQEAGGLRIYWNTGAGFVRGDWALEHDERGDLAHFRLSSTFDYDSDGRADLLLPDPSTSYQEASGWWVLRSTGSGFSLDPTDLPGADLGQYSPLQVVSPVGDHDADGIHDVAVGFGTYNLDLWRSETVFRDRLVEVVNGMGAANRFTYGLLRDPEVHETTLACTGSDRDACASTIRPIVRTMTVDNGLLAPEHRVLEYHYTGGAASREGRGFLGFERVRVVERQADAVLRVTDTEYDDVYDAPSRDHPFAHLPERVFVAERVHAPFEAERYRYTETRSTYDHRAHPDFAGVFDTVPLAKQVRSWDTAEACDEMVDLVPVCEDGELLALWTSFHETTWSHDEFGNVLTVRTATESEADYEETERAYLNDTVSWIIGRPTVHVDRSHTAANQLETRTHHVGYDPVTGLVAWVQREPGNAALSLRTTVETRDAHGNPVRVTQRDGGTLTRTTTTTWDTEGVYPVGHTNALGHSETLAFERGLGVPTYVSAATGVTHHWTTDGLGRVVQLRRTSSINGPSDGADVQVEYQAIDDGDDTPLLAVRTRQAGGIDATTEHDRLGRPVRETWVGFGGANTYATTEYDALGRVLRTSLPTFVGNQPDGYERREYDHANRLRAFIHADTSAVTYSYPPPAPASGIQAVLTFDEDARLTQYELDSRMRLVRTADALGGEICFDYGPFSVTTEIRRDCGAVTPAASITMTHDRLGRRTALSEPSVGLRTFGFNAWNELVSELRPGGASTSWLRDGLGRVTRRTDADGIATWTWDTAKPGLLSATASPDQIGRTFAYDAFDRLSGATTTADGSSFALVYGYDAMSRLSTVTHPASFGQSPQTLHHYDGSGRLDRITEGALTLWDAEVVDESGRLRQERFANGAVAVKTYDELRGRIVGIRTVVAGTTMQHLGYEWTPAGDLRQRRDFRPAIDHIEDLGYDELHRLETVDISSAGAVKHVDVTYDALGNVTSKSDVGPYSYAAERLTAAGIVALGYDNQGRVNSRGGSLLAWNASDRLRTIGAAPNDVSFRYDADRRRVRRSSAADGVVLTIDDRYERQTLAGAATHRYRVLAEGRVVAQIERRLNNGVLQVTRSYVHDDHLGSTDTITTSAGGLAGRMSFDAWGRARNPNNWTTNAIPGPVAGVDIGFTGHTARGDGPLLNMRARMYDPAIGRFMSPDPLVTEPSDLQSWNRYSYVRNRPLVWTDPSGRSDEPTYPVSSPDEDGIRELIGAPSQTVYADTGDDDGGTTGGEIGSGDVGVDYDESGGMDTPWDFEGTVEQAPEESPGSDTASGLSGVGVFLTGALLGDAGDGAGDGRYTTGHVAGSLIPGVGLAADARDIVVAGGDLLRGDGGWVPLVIAVVGIVPLGDLLKFGRLADDAIVLGDDAIEAGGQGAVLRATNEAGQVTSRGSWRRGTVDRAWGGAEPGPTGGRLCPTCRTEVTVPPRSGQSRDWDINHDPPWTKREFPPDVSRSQVLDNYQEGTWLECPTCNRSAGNRR